MTDNYYWEKKAAEFGEPAENLRHSRRLVDEERAERMANLTATLAEDISRAHFVTIVRRYDSPDRFGIHLAISQDDPGFLKVRSRTVGLFDGPDEGAFVLQRLPYSDFPFSYNYSKLPLNIRLFIIGNQTPVEWRSKLFMEDMEEDEDQGFLHMVERVRIYTQHSPTALEAIAKEYFSPRARNPREQAIVLCPSCGEDPQWAPDEAALVGKECHACFENAIEARLNEPEDAEDDDEIGAPIPEAIRLTSLMPAPENINTKWMPPAGAISMEDTVKGLWFVSDAD